MHRRAGAVDGTRLLSQMWRVGAIRSCNVRDAPYNDRVRVANQVPTSTPFLTPLTKSTAPLIWRLIGRVTWPGAAVVPAQTTRMRAIASKHERGSGGFSQGEPNVSRWFVADGKGRGRRYDSAGSLSASRVSDQVRHARIT